MNGRFERMSGMSGLLRMALVGVMALVFGVAGLVNQAQAAYTEPIYLNVYPVQTGTYAKNFNITVGTLFYFEFVVTDFNGAGVTGITPTWFTVNKWQDSAKLARTYTLGTVVEVGNGVYRMPFTATQAPGTGSILYGQFRMTDGVNLRLETSSLVGVGSAPTTVPTQFDGAPEFTCYPAGSAGTMTVTVAFKDGNNAPFTTANYSATTATNNFYVKEIVNYLDRNLKSAPTTPSGVNNGDGTYTVTFGYLATPAGTWDVSFEYYMDAAGNNKMKFPVGVQFSADCTGAPAVPANPNAPELNPVTNGTIAFSAATYAVGEAGPTVTITATRTGGSTGVVGISYATSNGTATAGSDYTATSSTLSWADGDAANKTFTVPVTQDTLDEANETFTVTLSAPTGGATLGTPLAATVTITDDDTAPTVGFSAATSSGSEATMAVLIPVTMSTASGQTVTVNYATSAGTATAAVDYGTTSGTLTFSPGVISQNVPVTVANDTNPEADETFIVTLSAPSNATLGTSPHTYTILNDDLAGSIQLASATYTVSEGGTFAVLTVTRTGGSAGAVGVSYATSNGTATAGSDYTTTSGTLSWAAGITASRTISVPILEDVLSDPDETINVTLSAPTGFATLGAPSSAVVTITDNDNAAPTLSIAEPNGVGDTVTVGASYNITYSLADSDNIVTAAFYYDTNADMVGGTAITGACATAAEGSGVTCAWNTAGVPTGVSYYVYGITNDGVNPAVSALSPGMITINPIINSTAAGTAAVTPGNGVINVSAPYTNDSNANNTLLVEWGLNGVNYSLGSSARTHAASPYAYTIPALTNGTAYQVRVTYQDSDTVTGTVVQTFTNITPSLWTDNAMLHNSNRFPGTTKHSGDWGTPTGAKGPILCSTCHTKGTPNIKRVTTSVSLTGVPGAAQTVSYTSAVDGSSDLASATGNHSTSNRICEVCHTYDNTQAVGVQVHAYDMSGATVPQQSHYLGSDCIKCHEHKGGFKASCTGCHASPPLVATDLTATLNPANTTASATAGKHALHANTKGYGCNTCHSGWETANEMPKTGNINIGFNAFTRTTGAYDGRTAATGGKYTAAVGTTLTQTKVGSTTTCAFYCHGSALPVWSDTATAVCGSCHGTATGMPSTVAGDGDLSGAITGTKVGKHSAHVITAGYTCALCHNGAGTGTAKHVDGSNDVVFDTALAGASASYSAGTCSNLICHSNAPWDTAATGGCTFCHGYPPTSAAIPANNKHAAGVTAVNHDKISAGGVVANHDDCSYCHGVKGNSGVTSTTAVILDPLTLKGLASKTYVWATDHRDGKVTMNGDTDTITTNDAGYNTTNAGCGTAACHANDATHQLTTGGAALVTKKDFGPGACATCHSDVASGAPQVTGTSTHVKVLKTGVFGDCTNCHAGHTTATGGVDIPNNATVGINYSTAGHTGIQLGGTGTDALINALTTEAQICWACHAAATNAISEWGTNAGTGSTYNYGALSGTSTSNWVGATWTSGTAKFGYKTGTIQSTHSVNSAATVPGVDAVADIRCSYCHDVHNLNLATSDTFTGAPYLRGTWLGNPYREDGAPQTGDTWTASGKFGAVPRGGTQSTELGGYQIDQNNANPTTGWTANSSAGLCELCHGNGDGNFTAAEIDSLNQFGTASTDWVGTNGHSAAVLGGGDSVAANIFTVTDRNTTAPTWINADATTDAGNPAMAQQHVTLGTGNRPFGFRSSAAEPDGWNLTPRVTGTYAQDGYNWGANTQTTLDSNYHNFSCSKCHNPHASRLPRLMITNCLDTKHNTWDNGQTTIPNGTTNVDGGATVSANNSNVKFSQATSAQNCHRLKDPAFTQSRGTGWNYVTPW